MRIRRSVALAALLAALLLLPVRQAPAQENSDTPADEAIESGAVGFHLKTFHPQGGLLEHNKSTGFGGSLEGGYRFPTMPVIVGADLSWMYYRYDSYSLPISGYTEPASVTINHSVGSMLAFARFMQPEGDFRPYFEGFLGFSLFFILSDDDAFADYKDAVESANRVSGALNYGGGGGIAIRIGESRTPEGDPADGDLFLDVRVRYIAGTKAWFASGEPLYEDPKTARVDFNPDRVHVVRTDYLTVQAGIMIVF